MDTLAAYIVNKCAKDADRFPILAKTQKKPEDEEKGTDKGKAEIASARAITRKDGELLIVANTIENLAIEMRTAALAFMQEKGFEGVEQVGDQLPCAPLSGRMPVEDEDWDSLFYEIFSRVYMPEGVQQDVKGIPTLGKTVWLRQDGNRYLEVPAFAIGGIQDTSESFLNHRFEGLVVASAQFPIAIEVAPRRGKDGIGGWPILHMQFEVNKARQLAKGPKDPVYMGRFTVSSAEIGALRKVSRNQAAWAEAASQRKYLSLPGSIRRPFLGGSIGSGRSGR